MIKSLTNRNGLPLNLVSPACVVSEGFYGGHQVNKVSHQEQLARVNALHGLSKKC